MSKLFMLNSGMAVFKFLFFRVAHLSTFFKYNKLNSESRQTFFESHLEHKELEEPKKMPISQTFCCRLHSNSASLF